jgi:hypothetical protein
MIISFLVGVVTGGVTLYLVLRANPQKAATVAAAVNTGAVLVGKVESAVATATTPPPAPKA